MHFHPPSQPKPGQYRSLAWRRAPARMWSRRARSITRGFLKRRGFWQPLDRRAVATPDRSPQSVPAGALLNPHFLEHFPCQAESGHGPPNRAKKGHLEEHFLNVVLGKPVVNGPLHMRFHFV